MENQDNTVLTTEFDMKNIPPALATIFRIAFDYRGGPFNEGKFDIMEFTSKADPYRMGLVFERVDHRMPSGERFELYKREQTPDISLSAPLHRLLVKIQSFLRECICMSTVLVLSPTKEITKNQSVMLVFVEFSLNQSTVLLNGYVIDNLDDHRKKCIDSMWQHIFPQLPVDPTVTEKVTTVAEAIAAKRQDASAINPDSESLVEIMVHEAQCKLSIKKEIQVIVQLLMTQLSQKQKKQLEERMNALIDKYQECIKYIPQGPYHPESHKLNILLDLDKTLLLSDADAREEQRHAFIGDFEISGIIAITSEHFQHRMMIRPGCYWFLRRLQHIANIYVITAGDLHYARAAVTGANARKWVSSKDPTTDNEDYALLSDVFIPLTHVFSVRNYAKRAAPKTFERALPWVQYLTSGAGGTVLAVDDDPGAWDVAVRHHVIPISPFQPLNNSHEHLLHVVWLIEQAAQRFFNEFHADLKKPRVKHNIPTGLPVTVQFFDSGRYVLFLKTNLVIDCSNGLNKMLSPQEVTQFYAEHNTISIEHTLEYPAGIPVTDVPVYIQMFEDGRYVVIGTKNCSVFMAFKYGGVMPFPNLPVLKNFLLTIKPMGELFYVGGDHDTAAPAAVDDTSAPAAVDDTAAPAAVDDTAAPATIEEDDFVCESYNYGQVVLYKVDNQYIATERGKFIMMLTTEEHVEFVSGLILDQPLDKAAETLFKTKKIVDVIRDLSSSV